ncbi:TPA: hypothetical protein VDU83_002714 [Pseudomonas aeruginosa]|nr:hypothetical protein [Pseudomonas aeruginosa]
MTDQQNDHDFDYSQLEGGHSLDSEGGNQINDLHSLCMSLKEQDESLVGETSLLWLSPDVLEEEEGFNLREYDRPDTQLHIQALKEAWMNGTQLPPLEVKIENGRCLVRDGHCRLRAARLAIEEGAPIKRIPVIELTGSAEASALRILTSNQQLKLTIMQRARGYARLRNEMGWNSAKIAKHICMTDTHVRFLIKLLTLPERMQELINKDVIRADFGMKMFNRYGEKAVELIDEAYARRLKEQESLLAENPETTAPIKVSTKHLAAPAPKITKKMASQMSVTVRSLHTAIESNATVDNESGEVAVKIPLDVYEQLLELAKALKEADEAASGSCGKELGEKTASQGKKPKADVIAIGSARKAG